MSVFTSPDPPLATRAGIVGDALCVSRAADDLWLAALCCCPGDEAQAFADRVRVLQAEMVAAIRGAAPC